jgi:hypothetical protein
LEVIEAGSIKRCQPGCRFNWNPGIQTIFPGFHMRHSFDIHVTTAMMVICSTDSLSANRRWLEKKLAIIEFVDGSFYDESNWL